MAQNYTRQSAFSDGDTITATLFNDEYNQLVNTFTYSSSDASATGHRHDGSTGEGGNIYRIGDLDFLNKIEADSTNNRWGFWVEVSSIAVEQLRIQDGAIVPVTDNDIDLGTSSLEFKNLYLDGTAKVDALVVDETATITGATTLSSTLALTGAATLSSDLTVAGNAVLNGNTTIGNAATDTVTITADVSSNIIPSADSTYTLGDSSNYWSAGYIDAITTTGNVSVGGNLTVTGNATISGNLTFGDADTDTVSFSADVSSHILPDVDDTYDLGSSTKEWRNLYVDGTANIDSLVADTADINGGTIDGATIATSDVTVGAGKTLDVSAGTLTLADNQISGDKVEGGTIAATTITSLASTTVDTTNIEVTNLKAKDGTAAGSIADTTGVVTLASSVLTTTDINGGTIDGATIGATTPAAGSFTTVSATGNITVDGTVDGRDVAADGTKLDGIEAGADVTDTANVTAAGALMDSELTNIAAVKALDQGVATTDSPSFAGLTTTADVSFGDNDKAIFGAGSDLQIYHDGSHSYISDQGTGRLYVQGSDAVRITDASAGNMLSSIAGDGVYAYFNTALKLATTSTGIDVTGTVTADGLTVDGDVKRNAVSLGSTASPAEEIGLRYQASSGVGNRAGIQFYNTYANNGSAWMSFMTSDTSNNFRDRMLIDGNGDISFYEDTGTTPKFFWDASAESLGIGTTSPSSKLQIDGSGSTTSEQLLSIVNPGGDTGAGARLWLSGTNSTTRGTYIEGQARSTGNNHDLIFATSATSASPTERMRIDFNGNLLVGTTNTAPSVNNVTGLALLSSGQLQTTADGASAASFNRKTSDGSIINLRKDGTTVGSIGSHLGAYLYIASANNVSGIGFYNNSVRPVDSNGSASDADQDLGASTIRWKDLYLSGGLPGTAAGSLVINENGVDSDFRVESDTNTHALFLNGGNSHFGIGESSPASLLHVSGSGSDGWFYLNNTNATADHVMYFRRQNSDVAYLGLLNTDEYWLNGSAASKIVLQPQAATELVINQSSHDADFRVESDTNTHALFVDAGNSYVGVNCTPQVELDVRRTANAYPLRIGSSSGEGRTMVFADVSGTPAKHNWVLGAQYNTDDGWELTPSTAVGGYTFTNRVLTAYASTGNLVVNENGIDSDFRVESDGNTHMLFVDAGNNTVGVGTTPSELFHVRQDSASGSVYGIIQNDGTPNTATIAGWGIRDGVTVVGGVRRRRDGSSSPIEIGNFTANNNAVHFQQNAENRITFENNAGSVVVNEDSLDRDFRVESNNNSNMIFVDASIDSVGIGTGSPSSTFSLDVAGAIRSQGAAPGLTIYESDASNQQWLLGGYAGLLSARDVTGGTYPLQIGQAVPTNALYLQPAEVVVNDNSADLDFRVESDSNSHMLFVDAGNNRVICGASAGSYGALFTATGANSYTIEAKATSGATGCMILNNDNGLTNRVQAYFQHGGSTVGSIVTTSSTTTYNTSSDARLKENIADAESASELIDAIQVRQFAWKADGSHQRYGMVAQELIEVAPEAVTGEPDGEEMMGVDYSKLVPMLIKEIQSLRARVAQLEGA